MTTVNHSQELTKESPQIKQSLGLSGNEIYHFAGILLREKKVSIPRLRGFTWQNLSGGLLRGRRFSDNMFVCARKT